MPIRADHQRGRATARGAEAGGRSTPLGGRISVAVDLSEALQDVELVDEDGDQEDVVYVYLTQADERVRPEHAALHGTVWEIDDPELPIPPIAPGCRCRLEARARTRTTARATGLPRQPRRPPEPGGEAVRQYLRDATDRRTGESVSPADLYGPEIGRLIQNGELDPQDVIGEDGAIVPALLARGLAQAGSAAARTQLKRLADSLRGLGITLARARSLIAEARRRDGGDLRRRLTEVLIEERPGLLGGGSDAVSRSRAREVAGWMLRVSGNG